MTAALAGRYAVERELGRGGMATVYLADDLALHRRVALKVLHPELAAAMGRERFLREVAIAARLTHPHILPVHDSGEADGRFYYAMPYVEGESLRQRLAREQQLPLDAAIAIVRSVAGALSYAHQQGVVHRDIKPENILLAGAPGAGQLLPLVADFGIARAMDAAGGDRLTETGLTLGTPAYMSPEQAAGSRRLDGRSDIYALGCVAYEMLAGTPPFTGASAQAVMARHVADPVPRLRTVRRAVPRAVELAVERALAKVPADRFATADEFAEALQSRSITWLRLEGRALRRLLVALVLVATAGMGVAALLGRRTAPSAVSAEAASAETIAVLPFRPATEDTALARLGRDLAATVSASLGGVGGLETTDRLSVAAAAAGAPGNSPQEDAALALSLRARRVLRGTLVREGSGVRLDLGLYDAERARPVLEGMTVTGLGDSLGGLTDAVVLTLLARLWEGKGAPSPSLSAVTTRSVASLRAFLDGERLFERGDMGAAKLAYRSAIAADSNFMLAYFRYVLAGSQWEGMHVESEVLRSLRRRLDLLPEREQLMARAFLTQHVDSAASLLREATRAFPGHWPAWFQLGDLITHSGPLRGYDWTEGLRAFRRAVELQPRLMSGWEHLYMYANGRSQPLADTAFARLGELGWDAVVEPYFRLHHGLGRTGGVIGPALSDLADSVVELHRTAPNLFGDRYGSFAMGILQSGFPAAQVELNRRRLAKGGGESDVTLEIGSGWAWAARGRWDSASAIMTRLAQVNPGTYVPRRFARFGDPVLAVESYAVAVTGAWLGGIPPEAADLRRPLALKAIGTLPDEQARAEARARIAWFDGLLGLGRGDRKAIQAARGDVARSGYRQSGRIGRSLAAFERAVAGDRAGAGRELASLEWACSSDDTCSPHIPEIGVQRLAAARWLQEAGEFEEAVRLLRWQDGSVEVFAATLGTYGKTLWGPTHLARAYLEEARGQPRLAAYHYRHFLRLYDQPMPAQMHLVAQAEEALARLGEGR